MATERGLGSWSRAGILLRKDGHVWGTSELKLQRPETGDPGQSPEGSAASSVPGMLLALLTSAPPPSSQLPWGWAVQDPKLSCPHGWPAWHLLSTSPQQHCLHFMRHMGATSRDPKLWSWASQDSLQRTVSYASPRPWCLVLGWAHHRAQHSRSVLPSTSTKDGLQGSPSPIPGGLCALRTEGVSSH